MGGFGGRDSAPEEAMALRGPGQPGAASVFLHKLVSIPNL